MERLPQVSIDFFDNDLAFFQTTHLAANVLGWCFTNVIQRSMAQLWETLTGAQFFYGGLLGFSLKFMSHSLNPMNGDRFSLSIIDYVGAG